MSSAENSTPRNATNTFEMANSGGNSLNSTNERKNHRRKIWDFGANS
jgi:hypothetical protein